MTAMSSSSLEQCESSEEDLGESCLDKQLKVRRNSIEVFAGFVSLTLDPLEIPRKGAVVGRLSKADRFR
jgi:hypothetical protein